MVSEKIDSVHVFFLDSGIPVRAIPIEGARTTSLAIGCKAGAFYETGFGKGSNDGISHFLEHMFFKGTPKMSSREINEAFTRAGAQLNAFTSNDITMYYAKVPSRNSLKAIELWGDLMSNLIINEEEFELERGVVMQEEKLGRDDPMIHAMNQAHSYLFRGTQLEHDIIGSAESLEGITREMMIDYIRHYYSPDNMMIAITGALDVDEIKVDLERHFRISDDRFVSNPNRVDPWVTVADPWRGKHEVLLEPTERPLGYVVLNWDVKVNLNESFYPGLYLDTIIDTGKNSLFYKDIVGKGICSTASFIMYTYKNVSNGTVIFSAPPGKIAWVHEKIIGVLTKVRDMPITDDLMVQLQREIVGRKVLGLEDPMQLAFKQIIDEVRLGTLVTPESRIKSIKGVTREDVTRLRDKFLGNVEWTIFATGALPRGWVPSTALD
ncbi:MAG: M16 family metallopeptidase [Promethearchaeota archaeon]